MDIHVIQAKTLDDSWFQLVYNILKHGRDFIIDEGSFAGHVRKEFDFVIAHIERPWERDVDGFPLIPSMPEGQDIAPPVDKGYLADYAPYIMSGEVAEGESYTYGQRLNKEPVAKRTADELAVDREIYRNYDVSNELCDIVFNSDKFLSQVNLAIEVYSRYERTNQMCLQVAKPTDMLLLDPPCLRHIDTRIQDGKLHFYPYFRSWDLWSGYPANLAGISMLQEHMAGEIGVEQGEMVCSSKGLHLYSYSVDFAKARCMIGEGKC